jgi:hypothetical protein
MHIAINAYFWNQTHTGSGQYTRQLVYYLNRLVSDIDITLVYPQSAAAGIRRCTAECGGNGRSCPHRPLGQTPL